ncbi:hypothetical protein [Bradyrhizobium sp. SZCCHNS2096]|uniref:hypothetical protein n=1 Tax=Bradyrhizobium TaxID=374 RepID=UPI002915E4EA|nr:hypothetical protein [Bradyrhizobium sp. SZCCHNS2096]
MNTNVTFLRGNAAAPGLEGSRANRVNQVGFLENRRDTGAPARTALVMVWRTNPASGRLECRWAVDGGAATDEGVSCNNLRQAA